MAVRCTRFWARCVLSTSSAQRRSWFHLQLRFESDAIATIATMITQRKDAHHVIRKISQYEKDNQTFDCAVYGKAMRKCGRFGDAQSCEVIMNMLLTRVMNNPKKVLNLSTIVFGIFLNEMAKLNEPFTAAKYFKIMLETLKIEPNIICFDALIKSCKSDGLYSEAETYWKLMENSFHIKADEMMYTQMLSVYANAHQTEKATHLFYEYWATLTKEQKEAPQIMPLFDAYLTVFSRTGCLQGMQDVTRLMKRHTHKPDVSMLNNMMRGFIVARDYHSALKTCRKILSAKQSLLKPDVFTLDLYGVILLGQIRSDAALPFAEKRKLFKQLEKHNDTQYAKYGLQCTPKVRITQLTAAIALYHNTDPQQICAVFEHMMARETKIEYIDEEKNVIRLHGLPHLVVQFLLRYLIAFQLTELCSVQPHGLNIVVGRIKAKEEQQSQNMAIYTIKQFVIDELNKFDPPIQCQEAWRNPGMIFIPSMQLSPHSKTHINHAKLLLTQPSTDWHFTDPRSITEEKTL